MIMGKGTKRELTIIETDNEYEAWIDPLNSYFNKVFEKIYRGYNGIHQTCIITKNFDTLSSQEIPEVIVTLLQLFRLNGRSADYKEHVFFTVSDIKRNFRTKKPFKNINEDTSKMMDKLHKLSFLDKFAYNDFKVQNIYYLTSKCENIKDVILITKSDEDSAEKALLVQRI